MWQKQKSKKLQDGSFYRRAESTAEKATSSPLYARLLPADIKAELKRLQAALRQIAAVMGIVEALKMKLPVTGQWVEQCREAVEASEFVLNELQYKIFLHLLKDRDWVGGSVSSSKKRISCTLNDGTLERLKEAVTMLDQVTNGVGKRLQVTTVLEIWPGRELFGQEVERDGHKSCNNELHKRRIKSWDRVQQLGAGSFGTVHLAISDEGFFFAVKEVLIDQGTKAQECITQLEQEIALLSQFEHKNIVQYYGTDKDETKLYIFLELVTQGSLASLYQKYKLQETQVSAYTRQILHGLVYLHERNIIHRDIKCANILVTANGLVKLADFGLAKKLTEINMLKSCKGSAYWMAPEVIHPEETYWLEADIWSLGCTVLEMLTGEIPYPNIEWQEAVFKIGFQKKQPLKPNYLSREAHDFIMQCVTVNPDDRPSAAELLEHPFLMIQ